MKNLVLIIGAFISFSFSIWETDFDKAKQIALQKHELILLNFSGSDWCGPCMRMKKEIFDSRYFSEMADQNLVLVNADFPRDKKHQLSKEIKKQNDVLAEKYNPDGKFPFTVLLSPDGAVVKTWEGLPDGAEAFTNQVKSYCHATK